MAVTTQTNDLWGESWSRYRSGASTWFGVPVPENVINISMMYDPFAHQTRARWRVKGDPTIYEAPFEQTDEGVRAVLVAMRLTC